MLIVCKECGRHIKSHEAQCPFCQEGTAPVGLRLQRVAAIALVGVSLSMAGCPRFARTKYGAPPPRLDEPSSQQSDSAPTDPSPEPERPATKYGAPPPPRR